MTSTPTPSHEKKLRLSTLFKPRFPTGPTLDEKDYLQFHHHLAPPPSSSDEETRRVLSLQRFRGEGRGADGDPRRWATPLKQPLPRSRSVSPNTTVGWRQHPLVEGVDPPVLLAGAERDELEVSLGGLPLSFMKDEGERTFLDPWQSSDVLASSLKSGSPDSVLMRRSVSTFGLGGGMGGGEKVMTERLDMVQPSSLVKVKRTAASPSSVSKASQSLFSSSPFLVSKEVSKKSVPSTSGLSKRFNAVTPDSQRSFLVRRSGGGGHETPRSTSSASTNPVTRDSSRPPSPCSFLSKRPVIVTPDSSPRPPSPCSFLSKKPDASRPASHSFLSKRPTILPLTTTGVACFSSRSPSPSPTLDGETTPPPTPPKEDDGMESLALRKDGVGSSGDEVEADPWLVGPPVEFIPSSVSSSPSPPPLRIRSPVSPLVSYVMDAASLDQINAEPLPPSKRSTHPSARSTSVTRGGSFSYFADPVRTASPSSSTPPPFLQRDRTEDSMLSSWSSSSPGRRDSALIKERRDRSRSPGRGGGGGFVAGIWRSVVLGRAASPPTPTAPSSSSSPSGTSVPAPSTHLTGGGASWRAKRSFERPVKEVGRGRLFGRWRWEEEVEDRGWRSGGSVGGENGMMRYFDEECGVLRFRFEIELSLFHLSARKINDPTRPAGLHDRVLIDQFARLLIKTNPHLMTPTSSQALAAAARQRAAYLRYRETRARPPPVPVSVVGDDEREEGVVVRGRTREKRPSVSRRRCEDGEEREKERDGSPIETLVDSAVGLESVKGCGGNGRPVSDPGPVAGGMGGVGWLLRKSWHAGDNEAPLPPLPEAESPTCVDLDESAQGSVTKTIENAEKPLDEPRRSRKSSRTLLTNDPSTSLNSTRRNRRSHKKEHTNSNPLTSRRTLSSQFLLPRFLADLENEEQESPGDDFCGVAVVQEGPGSGDGGGDADGVVRVAPPRGDSVGFAGGRRLMAPPRTYSSMGRGMESGGGEGVVGLVPPERTCSLWIGVEGLAGRVV
ncbi:hypothetical protein HDU67_006974 [Dinochytrium kinnereticum]|nr:hypothetical protein HDU67_006974 [Dinochytrium kinnereticum]